MIFLTQRHQKVSQNEETKKYAPHERETDKSNMIDREFKVMIIKITMGHEKRGHQRDP